MLKYLARNARIDLHMDNRKQACSKKYFNDIGRKLKVLRAEKKKESGYYRMIMDRLKLRERAARDKQAARNVMRGVVRETLKPSDYDFK